MSDLSSSDKTRVLSRIKKLLALAHDDRAPEGERDNALRAAHATLAKYNLSMSELKSDQPDDPRVKGEMRTKDFPWMRTCAFAIAKLFFCEYFYNKPPGSTYQTHHFIGRSTNATSAQDMTNFVLNSILREARCARANAPESVMAPGAWERNFCKGAAHRISERCNEIRATATKPPASLPVGSSNTALVLASFYDSEREANKKWLAQIGITTRATASRQRSNTRIGYDAGRAFGDSLNLNSNTNLSTKHKQLS